MCLWVWNTEEQLWWSYHDFWLVINALKKELKLSFFIHGSRKVVSQWFSGKGSTCQCRRHRFKPLVRRMPWRRKCLSTSVFLLVKLHEQTSLAGYSPWGLKEVDSTGYTHTHTHTHTHYHLGVYELPEFIMLSRNNCDILLTVLFVLKAL